MSVRLTYYFFISLALCLLASCATDEPAEISGTVPMEFSADTQPATSRGGTAALSQFAVFSDIRHRESVATMVMFENMPVTYNAETGKWEYRQTYGTQYWIPRNEHSFVAIHPASVVDNNNGASRSYSGSQLSFTYSLPANDYIQATDILAATHRRYYEDGATDKVVFGFGHILSMINIAPELNDNSMNESDYIQFHKIELSGFKTKAAFSIKPASILSNNQTNDRVFEITSIEGYGSYVIEIANPKIIKNHAGNINLFEYESSIIMLPQTFALDSDASIRLTYSMNGGTDRNEIVIPISNTAWNSGTSYTYKFLFDIMGLKITTIKIAPWTDKKIDFDFTIQ